MWCSRFGDDFKIIWWTYENYCKSYSLCNSFICFRISLLDNSVDYPILNLFGKSSNSRKNHTVFWSFTRNVYFPDVNSLFCLFLFGNFPCQLNLWNKILQVGWQFDKEIYAWCLLIIVFKIFCDKQFDIAEDVFFVYGNSLTIHMLDIYQSQNEKLFDAYS